MTADQVVQIVMYVLVGIASIASAVISYIKTGSWGKSTTAAAKSVDIQLNEINSNILRRLESLESRVETIEKNEAECLNTVVNLDDCVSSLSETVDGLCGDRDQILLRVGKTEQGEVL